LSVCLRQKRKRPELSVKTRHVGSSVCIDPEVKRSRSRPWFHTYASESHDDTECNEQGDVSTCGYRDQHGGSERDENTHAEHVLAAVQRRQPASEHLSQYVAVEERAQNVTTKFLAPFQLALQAARPHPTDSSCGVIRASLLCNERKLPPTSCYNNEAK